MSQTHMPIDDVLGPLLEALSRSPCVVLQAPTGAGKTTGVPPALLASALLPEGQIIVLEPRRIAARAAARRMAAMRKEAVGETVGYQVRFDRKVGPGTRILVVTEGIFVRMLQDDPFLDGIGAVIFDEFHERSLLNDVALAMTRKVQREVREDLKLVVMSATLATEQVASYLDDCPVIASEGRSYPVEIEHLSTVEQRSMVELAATGVRQMQRECRGDILVFLPGVGEIRRLASTLASWAERQDVALVSLFGDLSPKEQDAALLPGARQKVILSTNVAETSVTIEGVEGVVDTGLARRLRHDVGSGLNRLELVPISQASADQRAGRAGRMGPGRCLRLWPAAEHQRRSPQDLPEIRLVDLAATTLELLAWGETDLASFPWLEAPEPSALESAHSLLHHLDATDDHGNVTALGQQMATLPVHPRLSRLILAGARWGCLDDACLVAALLSERDPFRKASSHNAHYDAPPVSLWERLSILKAFQRDKGAGGHLLKAGAAHFVWQAQRQLMRLARKTDAEAARREIKGLDDVSRLTQACLAAFPDRVARRRHAESHRAVMADGRGVRLASQELPLPAALCVCLQIGQSDRSAGARGEAIIRQMLEIDEAELPEESCRERTEIIFDPERQRVMAMSRRYFHGLLLREKVASIDDDAKAEEVLAEAAALDIERALDLSAPEVARWLARLHSLGGWMPELELPSFVLPGQASDVAPPDDDAGETDELDAPDEAEETGSAGAVGDVEGESEASDDAENSFKALLPLLCAGRRSFDELRKAPLLDILQGSLTYPQRQKLDQWAPERIQVPSGSRVKLQYEPGKPPVLAVRIQEVFGWADTPRIANGRVPVLLHLLAPNMRPQQITQDLRSFWENTYTEVRKELRQRYPKHAWPEDPWNAQPERRPRRRR